jgi:hypothetical protein
MKGRFFWFSISVLMHPLLLISYAFLLMFFELPYYQSRFFEESPVYLILYVFSNTCILPTIAVLVMRKTKVINSIYLNDQNERHLPYALTTLFCTLTTWQLYQTNLGEMSYRFMLGVTIVIALVTVINLFWKISAHAAAAAGMIALLFYFVVCIHAQEMLVWLIISIIMAGMSGASRIFLQVHSKQQIYWGFLLGFSTVFITVAL